MKAAFTIVAKNYLPLAMTLGDSLKKQHPDLPFYIFLADDVDDAFQIVKINHPIIEVKDLNLPNLQDWAFKYNVTEFCTTIKPYSIEYLFDKGYDRVIYFDPDVFVFNCLDQIYADLLENFIVITPHFVTPEITYSGAVPEGLILFVGIYNLGFVGVSDSKEGRLFIQWWKDRLNDKGHADKLEGFHTDQKWIDFVPALFQRGVKILYDLGCNVSFWNLHERYLTKEEGTSYLVRHVQGTLPSTQLTFYHFAGFDPNNLKIIHKNHPTVPLEKYPSITEIMEMYRENLLQHSYHEFIKMPYKYNVFSNGKPIIHFQRRVYKQLSKDGWKFGNPFNLGKGSFYELMAENKMLVESKGLSIDRMNERNTQGLDKKISKINFVFKIVKTILGMEKYALLTKFFLRYFRPENQLFLIRKNGKYKFINENQ